MSRYSFGAHMAAQLTPAQRRAISYIGRCRGRVARYGKGQPISTRTFNALSAKRLVMENGPGRVMLTWNGELVFTALHPKSKYAIKKG